MCQYQAKPAGVDPFLWFFPSFFTLCVMGEEREKESEGEKQSGSDSDNPPYVDILKISRISSTPIAH